MLSVGGRDGLKVSVGPKAAAAKSQEELHVATVGAGLGIRRRLRQHIPGLLNLLISTLLSSSFPERKI